MPETIGGWGIFEANGDILLLAAPFIIAGYYCYIFKGWHRTAMLVLVPGLYLLSGVSTFKTQIALFHLGNAFPLIDNTLGEIDAKLNFDWVAYFDWVVAHDQLRAIISIAYQSIWVQPFVICVALAAQGRIKPYFTFQTALPLSFALTCIIATIMPALGAYQYHNIDSSRHVGFALEFTDQMTGPMLWLRQPELASPMPFFRDLRLITFPSWHAAAAIIFVLAGWPMPRLRYLFIVLNIMMLLATPVQGSHYLTDIIVGSLVGILAYLASKLLIHSASVAPVARQERSTGQETQYV